MKKSEKLLLFALTICLILVGIISIYNYHEVRGNYLDNQLEFFEATELYKYDDVIEYLEDNGYRYEAATNSITITKDAKYADEYLNVMDVIRMRENDSNITEEDIRRIIKEYGLERPETILNIEKSFVLVEREIQDENLVVMNTWYFDHVHSEEGFIINAINIGTDPLDSMNGTIRKYNLDGTTYVKSKKSHKFKETQIGSGLVTKWKIGKEAVNESFEYAIEVEEDGVKIRYHNKGKHDEIRY